MKENITILENIAIMIQKVWKGYRIRKFFKAIHENWNESFENNKNKSLDKILLENIENHSKSKLNVTNLFEKIEESQISQANSSEKK